jgi:hypothetical protein
MGLELAWWAVAFSAALLVFINIQSYYNDPLRRQFEQEWYEQFVAAQRRRYADTELDWRAKDLNVHFGSLYTDKDTREEWRASRISVWPARRRKPPRSAGNDGQD